MALCPKCNSEIDHLLVERLEKWLLTAEGDYTLVSSVYDIVFKCPNCNEILFNDIPEGEVQAVEFLKGGSD